MQTKPGRCPPWLGKQLVRGSSSLAGPWSVPTAGKAQQPARGPLPRPMESSFPAETTSEGGFSSETQAWGWLCLGYPLFPGSGLRNLQIALDLLVWGVGVSCSLIHACTLPRVHKWHRGHLLGPTWPRQGCLLAHPCSPHPWSQAILATELPAPDSPNSPLSRESGPAVIWDGPLTPTTTPPWALSCPWQLEWDGGSHLPTASQLATAPEARPGVPPSPVPRRERPGAGTRPGRLGSPARRGGV